MINLKLDNKEMKIYILIFCAIVLYAILLTLKNIPLMLIGSSESSIYNIIYQFFAIGSTGLFLVSWRNKSYEQLIEQLKKYITGLGAITVYFLLSELQLLPFQLLDIDITKIPLYLKIIYLLCYEAILIGIIVLIHLKKLKGDFNLLKNNHEIYFKNCLKYWLIALFIMYISNFIIFEIQSGLPANEEIIRQQFQVSPIYIFISAVLFAPIIEELIFRQSFRNLFQNKWLFIIISGLVFGGMHVFTGNNISKLDLLYLIPYSAPGMAFAYMLYKTDNIFVSMGFHMLHNGIMIALQFLTIYFL